MIKDILQFFEAFGFGEGDRIYIRAIAPKKVPIDVLQSHGLTYTDRASGEIKASRPGGYLQIESVRLKFVELFGKTGKSRTHSDGLKYLRSLNKKGFGLYFIPNRVKGFAKVDFEARTALFYEFDGLDFDSQFAKLHWLKNKWASPVAVVKTFKSLHVYLKTEVIADCDQAQDFQRRFLQLINCDDLSLDDPTQLMRLPFFKHWRWDPEAWKLKSVKCELVEFNPDVEPLTLDEIYDFLPPLDKGKWKPKTTGVATTKPIEGDGSDMRVLAQFLPGFDEPHRENWYTVQCPLAHRHPSGGNSTDSLHIAMDSGQFKSHCGCDSKEVYKAAMANAKANSHQFIDTTKEFENLELTTSERLLGEPQKTDIKPNNSRSSNPNVTFLQRAETELFSSDRWITVNGTLHRWKDNHYKPYPDEKLTPKIKQFADSFKVEKTGKDGISYYTYPHARPSAVAQVLDWVKHGFAISSDQINPPGINCTNGVLEICWMGSQFKFELTAHDPSRHYFLSKPLAAYNPDADPLEYQRLAQCLDPKPLDIWEKTIAASLDLEAVRRFRGRAVRAVFLKGDGANGKDTLRMIAGMILGNGAIASCSAIDWKQYDSGRYFPVYSLRGKRINWPSENADVGRIDALKGLRAAITGDPITFEAKNKMGVQEPCKAVFLFNINEAPNIVAKLKATESRWGIIPFSKTYSSNPKNGELLADPRFKEDPEFIRKQILPAFLNRLLEQLQNVVNEGIDYSSTQGLFEEMQRESSHLLQFAYEEGLEYNPDGVVTVRELWERLESWYIANGTLVIEEPPQGSRAKPKRVWYDQPNKGDRNVKGANQVLKRFLEIFPKARGGKMQAESTKNYVPIINGLTISSTIAISGQDDQDGQEEIAKTYKEKGIPPRSKNGQVVKNWLRTDQELAKIEPDPADLEPIDLSEVSLDVPA